MAARSVATSGTLCGSAASSRAMPRIVARWKPVSRAIRRSGHRRRSRPMIVCRSSMLSRFINGILRRRPGMLGLDHLTGGTLSSGHRPLVHFQLATGGTFWVATEAGALAAKRSREGAPRPRSSRVRACAHRPTTPSDAVLSAQAQTA